MSHDVVIVGAGLAGLMAARTCAIHGLDVAVVEAADDVGGRVRTDVVDGLLIDRGFQLLNPAYPQVRRVLDLDALALRAFVPGVVAMTPRGPVRLADPRQRPGWAPAALAPAGGSIAAKLRFAAYAWRTAQARMPAVMGRPDGTAERALRDAGVDGVFLERVVRPFLAGVFLEDDLATSRHFLDLVLRSFVRGTPAVPAAGMGAIPRQLHRALPPGTVRLSTPARAVAAGRVTTDDGDLTAPIVIVATDAPAAHALLPTIPAATGRSVTTWSFVADRQPMRDAVLLVDADGPVLNTVVMTNAAPEYASDGRCLVSASALGVTPAHPDDVRAHLARLYRADTSRWELAATRAIPYALPPMSVPLNPRPTIDLGEGILLAGDHRATASIQGAMASGHRAARMALQRLRPTLAP